MPKERNDALTSISRLSQLYDLEKVFASTLEMDELLPIIGSKFREVLECAGVNIWLLMPDESVKLPNRNERSRMISRSSGLIRADAELSVG